MCGDHLSKGTSITGKTKLLGDMEERTKIKTTEKETEKEKKMEN